MNPEHWDSVHDINQHMEQYHPEVMEPVAEGNWADYYRPGSFQAVFADIFQEAFDLLCERQRKYGPQNIEQLGLWGIFGRFADDKVERLRRSFNGTIDHGVLTVEVDGDFGDESWEDACVDSANYPLIMLAYKRGLWGAPLQEDMDEHDRGIDPDLHQCGAECSGG